MMRLPLLNTDDYSAVDIETVKKMADLFMQRGFTYYDTAYPYHNGKSEVAFREAVAKRYPRNSFTVTDKMLAGNCTRKRICSVFLMSSCKDAEWNTLIITGFTPLTKSIIRPFRLSTDLVSFPK
jgi:predicted aldo/keto reductase-like oxidoreductase